MQLFTYPESDLDRGDSLLRVLGSYWSKTFQAPDQVSSYTQAIAAGAKQLQLELLETIAALSRFKIPVFHTENWHPIVLHSSQLNLSAASLYKFEQAGFTFDTGNSANFDSARPTNFFAFPAPSNMVGAGHIFDRVLFPTTDLVSGADFIVDSDDQVVIFTQNPFDIESLPKIPTYNSDGQLVNETIVLWAFRANFDYQYVFRQFAYAVNIQLKSGENAKALVNAVFDGLINGGASASILSAALSAIFDVPVVRSGGETVEVITTDRRGVLIATDKHVYRFAAGSMPTVALGQTLREGDTLVDTFDIIDIRRGEIPDDFLALAIDQNMTSACYYSDLIFENLEVPLRVDTNHPSGYTFVDFQLSGFPADVHYFFADMHARGMYYDNQPIPTTKQNLEKVLAVDVRPYSAVVITDKNTYVGAPGIVPAVRVAENDTDRLALGTPVFARIRSCDYTNFKKYGTLAHLLDLRKDPVGEPQADDLPATINPLQFLVKNILRNHTTIVTVKLAGLGRNKLDLYNIRHVRQLIPPYAGLFFVYNLNGLRDAVPGDDLTMEDMTVFRGMSPVSDTIPVINVRDKGVIVRTVSGTCE